LLVCGNSIISFHFHCSYQFIVMFYLTCLMFVLAGHNDLSVVIGVASWGCCTARRRLM
jgi:hypothetical protein